MSSRLADRLLHARRSQFVGRTSERDLFRSALAERQLPFNILYIYGPGGIGKSTLVQEYIRIAEQTETPAIYLDGRDLDPSPPVFVAALAAALGAPAGESPAAYLARQARRYVLILDTYEQLAPLDRWLRQEFLPELPDSVLVVFAGQNPPALAWRADPGWQSLLRVLPLRNLNPEDAREYLARCKVPEAQHKTILDFTYNFPLALSLVAEVFAQRPDTQFEEQVASDVVRSLLERLVQRVPGPAHRAALEACAMIRVTTESLLARMLAIPDARELFDWLRGLSFISANREGLYPHDLVREALNADVRWRNPDWYAELHGRAREYFMTHLNQTSGVAQQRILVDYVFLHRDNPTLRQFLDWEMRESGLLSDVARASDIPALVAMVESFEGEESAKLAAYWFERQPEGVIVYRNDEGAPEGLLAMVALERVEKEDIAADSAVRSVVQAMQRNAPLRPGERATLFRFWMADESYQSVSSAQSMIFISIIQHYLTTPALALTFIPCADPDFWQVLLEYANVMRLREANFTSGGKSFGVYYHDWRVETPIQWLNLMAEREVGGGGPPQPPTATREPLLVLSEPNFAEAMRDALRDFVRPDLLTSNPLLRSRLIVKQVGISASKELRAATLQRLVKDAAQSLASSPRDAKFLRTLEHTYFHPAPTQEAAAELLDLPFSTYRRHLKSGIERLTEILWNAELNAT